MTLFIVIKQLVVISFVYKFESALKLKSSVDISFLSWRGIDMKKLNLKLKTYLV